MIRWLIAFMLLALPGLAEPLSIGTESDFQPYVFMDESDVRDGYDVDLANLICARGGFECSWIEVPFDQLFTGVATGQFDIAIGGIGTTPDRDLIVDWTRSYRRSDESIGSFAGLTDKVDFTTARIGVLGGSTQMNILLENGFDPKRYASNQAVLDALFIGEIDAFFGSRMYLSRIIDAGETRLIELGSITYDDQGPQIAVSKTNPELRDRLNVILDELDKSGAIAVIAAKWFPQPEQSDL